MKEVILQDGEHISYTYTKKSITFDEDISINLKNRERDEKVMIDVCEDEDGNLVIGVGEHAEKYVAQVEIPARQYAEEEGTDEQGKETVIRKPVDFDINNCTVYLFAL